VTIGWTTAGRWLGKALLGLAALIVGYGVAGLIGGSIPAHAGWRPPAAGVTIFVETNGVHTDLVLPAAAAGVDWRDLVRPQDIADPRYAAYDHLAFGWGEARFYLETPTWADVRPGTVLRAALGSDRTLVHVEHIPAPEAGPDARRIVLRPDEYRRLAAFIRASFAGVPQGRRPRVYRGYGAYDAFYSGAGRYDALMTCNAWTGAALRAAGVRVGVWTPFAVTVTEWFR
jgi:uncharacterized protein (TIGR02117 family)